MNQPGEGRTMWMLEMKRNGRGTSLMLDGQGGLFRSSESARYKLGFRTQERTSGGRFVTLEFGTLRVAWRPSISVDIIASRNEVG